MRLLPAALLLSAVTTGAMAQVPPQRERPTMTSEALTTPPDVQAVAPTLGDYTSAVLRDDLWARTDLTPRDRSLVTVVALIAGGHGAQLPAMFAQALSHGVTPSHLSEIVTHLAFYTGWPNSMSAAEALKGVFAARGIDRAQLTTATQEMIAVNAEAETQRIASVEQRLGSVAPALSDFTNGVLFGDVWRRPGLSPRDRSLVTVTALIARGNTAQLVGHLNRGLDNGLTRAEVGAVITHLAFYAGWPNAMSAASVAKSVFEKRPS